MLTIKESILKLFLLTSTVGAHINKVANEQQQQQDEVLSRGLQNDWAQKNVGRYTRKFGRVITKDLEELQGIIIDENGTSLYDALVEARVIVGFSNFTTPLSQADGLLFAYDPSVSMILSPPFSDGTYQFHGCENEEFGVDGKFNDVVCETLNKFTNNICMMKEDTCNKNLTTNVMVGYGKMLSDLSIVARLICLDELREDPTSLPVCFSTDVTDLPVKYLTTAGTLQYLAASHILPNGYDNRLLSFTSMTMLTDEPGFEKTNIVNGVIGKSYLDIVENFNPEFTTLELKSSVAWLAAASYFPQGEGYHSNFALHAVKGYLMFKYSKFILTSDERKLWKKYVLQATRFCAVHYGIKHAIDCKTMDELLDVVDDYEDKSCKAHDALDLFYEVKQFMRKKNYWNKNCVTP